MKGRGEGSVFAAQPHVWPYTAYTQPHRGWMGIRSCCPAAHTKQLHRGRWEVSVCCAAARGCCTVQGLSEEQGRGRGREKDGRR